MTTMPRCPSDDTLRRLALDSLAPDAFAVMDEHIAGCGSCKQRLGRLVRECPSTGSEVSVRLPTTANPPAIPDFEIERELGRGAMGVVYLARDQKLGRHVALKVMPGAQSADGVVRKRWRTEALAFSRVRHANVVSLYEIGESDSWLFLVLEYIPGGTLKSRLVGPVTQGVAASLVAKIATAVQKIHSAKLLHLDLKPSNILVDSEEDAPLDRVTPKVADFGIARVIHGAEAGLHQNDTTLIGPWGGTPRYMAPEQISGTRDQLGPGADIHALGTILYELLTGRPPFQGASDLDTLDLVRNTDAVSPRQINPHLSRDLETITLKCLRKEPNRRYESAQGLADDLSRFLEHRPILARPVSRPERAWRWCRRRPALATTLSVLAATVLFSLVALQGLYAQTVSQRDRAESALERVVKHRQIGLWVIATLQGIVQEALAGLPLEGERLENTAMELRSQIAEARTIAGFGHYYLKDPDTIGGHLAVRFAQAGRLQESRSIARDRVEILRMCYDHDTGDRDCLWRYVDACISAARIEDQSEPPEEALAFLDQAARLVKNGVRDDPLRPVFATLISEMYRQLQNESAVAASSSQVSHARAGRIALFNFLNDDHPGSPEAIYLRARLLADHGQWDEARGLAEKFDRLHFSSESERTGIRSALSNLVVESFSHKLVAEFSGREIRPRLDAAGAEDNVGPVAVDQFTDRMLVFIANQSQEPKIAEYCALGLSHALRSELNALAARHRKAGRLDEAERVTSLHIGLAEALVKRFPANVGCHRFQAEAYMQQSKNAWKRENLPAIRRGLERSIEVLNQAMLLDANDPAIRGDLLDHAKRLAALPKS